MSTENYDALIYVNKFVIAPVRPCVGGGVPCLSITLNGCKTLTVFT